MGKVAFVSTQDIPVYALRNAFINSGAVKVEDMQEQDVLAKEHFHSKQRIVLVERCVLNNGDTSDFTQLDEIPRWVPEHMR